MADQLGRSVGDMYEGAFIPGLMLACLYALYVFGVTIFFPEAAPGLPVEAQRIKEDPALNDIPIVVVSTSDREEDVAYAFQTGAVAYISKSGGFDKFNEELAGIHKYGRAQS